MLDKLDAAGVRLTAVEFGNEINTSGYNGDTYMYFEHTFSGIH